MHPDDYILVKRTKDGEPEAFDELVRRYETKIYTLAYRFTGNHADAGDLAQETFIRVYQSLSSFRGDSSFATWLYRVASNVCRDELRRQQRRKKVSLDEMLQQPSGPALYSAEESPQEALEKAEIRELVQGCLDELSEEHRLILVMREIQGLSYEEMADTLDCNLGTVKSRLSRARQALKQRMKGKKELLDEDGRLLR